MVRAAKKREAGGEPNPEAIKRKRLKGLALSKSILSETPAKSHVHLEPSKTVVKHHGSDILRKSQRKNRYLFSFPGLIAPTGGGKIGELKDLGTKNPILYLDFPQGQMKLFGTIVYPKNRYLTLQFSRGGKNAMCEDYFDNMIVFSDAWWIGTKDENPEEARLEFPKEFYEVLRLQLIKVSPKIGCNVLRNNHQRPPLRMIFPTVKTIKKTQRRLFQFDAQKEPQENHINLQMLLVMNLLKAAQISLITRKKKKVHTWWLVMLMRMLQKKFSSLRKIESVLQDLYLKRSLKFLPHLQLRKFQAVIMVHLSKLLYPHYSKRWKKRRLQEPQRNFHHQKIPPKSCRMLVQKGS
ncbi:uncharacterized protein LOC114715843 isoform X4 [Neltuma alba]|uniref:uncharacterized protein LOC114715843 isoform X4 n=1 Tax=Neltuma alba TaxID=207710 RepID=UPI0010A485A1|nr:uncharacterized protein LOC114715843 isoform X4 [Prosopis alba]